MRSAIPLLVGLLLVAILTLFCARHVVRDVQQAADTALAEGGMDWATAETDGRFIRLTGTAPSADALAHAEETTLAREAVTRVTSDIELRPVSDSDLVPVRSGMRQADLGWVDVGRTDRTLELSGLASAESQREEASTVAGPLWPWGPIDNSIRVGGSQADQSALTCRQGLSELLAVENVNFESASANLSSESRDLLALLASILENCPATDVAIEAHSDNTGEADYNLTLSQARAESVVAFLQTAGVEADRLSARGYGETRPIASNETEDGKAQNRRVEFRIR